MKVRHLLKYLLIWLLLSSSFHFANGKEFNLQGEVERVMDGDTVQLITANSTKVKIRLLGIDAPESDQSFGSESKQHLIRLSGSQIVTAQCIGVDRYKRSLCKIVANGIDLNLEQLKSGMAWHYKAYASSQNKKDQGVYASAEIQAQNARVGLWAGKLTIPPWEYRRGSKTDRQTSDSIETTGVVKMSRSKICHQPGDRFYVNTTIYTAFKSMNECLTAGGRKPKN